MGARTFATGLHGWIYGSDRERVRFERWTEQVAALPRRQTRVLTWPIVTVFGFIARPRVHMFLKPTVTRMAADAYEFDFEYQSMPQSETYSSLLDFARRTEATKRTWVPANMIDARSCSSGHRAPRNTNDALERLWTGSHDRCHNVCFPLLIARSHVAVLFRSPSDTGRSPSFPDCGDDGHSARGIGDHSAPQPFATSPALQFPH